jgi:hypothetical protein
MVAAMMTAMVRNNYHLRHNRLDDRHARGGNE